MFRLEAFVLINGGLALSINSQKTWRTCFFPCENVRYESVPRFGDYLELHSSKLAWQWKVPMCNREYIFNPGPFYIAMLVYQRVRLKTHGYTILLPFLSTEMAPKELFATTSDDS